MKVADYRDLIDAVIQALNSARSAVNAAERERENRWLRNRVDGLTGAVCPRASSYDRKRATAWLLNAEEWLAATADGATRPAGSTRAATTIARQRANVALDRFHAQVDALLAATEPIAAPLPEPPADDAPPEFVAGMTAATNGASRESNPYRDDPLGSVGSICAGLWDDGWDVGESRRGTCNCGTNAGCATHNP
jgi:hypothetical protein